MYNLIVGHHLLIALAANAEHAGNEVMVRWSSTSQLNPFLRYEILQHLLNLSTGLEAPVEACEGQINRDRPHPINHLLEIQHKRVPARHSLNTKKKGADYVERERLHQRHNLKNE